MATLLEPVLVVDDDLGTAELERRSLNRAGITTLVAHRVEDALTLLRQKEFSAILLDYQLPDGDSWAIVEAASSRARKVPVILVTAQGNERVAAEALHRGVTDYVRKAGGFLEELPAAVARVTTLAQTQERQRRTDALFHLIAQNSTDLIEVTDRSGVIRYVSGACVKMLGYEATDMIGNPLSMFVDHSSWSTSAHGPADEGPLQALPWRRKDGTLIWVESSTRVVFDEKTGEPTERISIHRDVTGSKRAHESFRTLVEEAPAGIVAHRDGIVAYANPAFVAALGLQRADELGGWPLAQFFHEDDRSFVIDRLVNLHAATGRAVPRARGILPDGSVSWFEANPIRVEFEGAPAVLVMFRDVTAERRAEVLLRDSEARFRTLFAESPLSLWEEDLSQVRRYLNELRERGVQDLPAYLAKHPEAVLEAAKRVRVLAINRATLALYGATSQDEFLGALPDTFTAEALDTFREELCALASGATEFEATTRTRNLAGQTNDISVRVNLIPGHETKWGRAVVSIFDLTELKANEARIADSLREKEVLLKEVHHRVKNNLQMVASLLRLQSEKIKDPETKATFADVRGRIQAISRLHEGIYRSNDLSHIDAAEYLGGIVREISRASVSPVRVDVTLHADPIGLPIDVAIPVGLILNELVTNAFKHAFPATWSGQPRVFASLSRCGESIVLSVGDNGVGLSDEFDVRTNGSLGMSLVSSLSRQLGGKLTVHRAGGSEYRVEFVDHTAVHRQEECSPNPAASL